MELRRAYSSGKPEQDFRAVLAAFRVGQPQWLRSRSAYLFADCPCASRADLGDLDPRKRHAIYGAIAVEFPACRNPHAACCGGGGGGGVPFGRRQVTARVYLVLHDFLNANRV